MQEDAGEAVDEGAASLGSGLERFHPSRADAATALAKPGGDEQFAAKFQDVKSITRASRRPSGPMVS